ncbi:hypothetical protein ARSEF1564_008887 [Beauveria bassiana]
MAAESKPTGENLAPKPSQKPVWNRVPDRYALGSSCFSSEQGVSVNMSESGHMLPPGGCFRSAPTKSIIQSVSKKMKHVVDN